LGTFPAAGPVASDSTVGRAFILNSSGSFGMYDQITAFNESTFVPIGSFSVAGVGQPGGTNPSSLVRWGADGLAFRTPSQIYIVRNALVRDLSGTTRSEEHTSELQSRSDLVCRLLLEKKK